MVVRENCMAKALSSKDVGVGIFACLRGEMKRFMLSGKNTNAVVRHLYV